MSAPAACAITTASSPLACPRVKRLSARLLLRDVGWRAVKGFLPERVTEPGAAGTGDLQDDIALPVDLLHHRCVREIDQRVAARQPLDVAQVGRVVAGGKASQLLARQ